MFKSGFVNVIGKPNVGKSTLCNALLGEDLSIITPKAQTTRHRILGIINGEQYQLILSDTPGILKPNNKMHETMLHGAYEAIEDADILIVMADANEPIDMDEIVVAAINQLTIPIIMLVNKIDKAELYSDKVNEWLKLLPGARFAMGISALKKNGIETLKRNLIQLLPEHPAYFDTEDLTDRSERFIVNEKIREKILLLYKEEIPYNVEVVTESFKDTPTILRIASTIYAGRESHKNIIIGKNGEGIKKLGTKAREDLEKFFQKKIFLELHVKVRDNWKNDERMLKYFGYIRK